MKKNLKVLPWLGWILSAVLLISGLIFGVQTLRDFNRSEIIIEWSTASELDTVGYNILRGEDEAGPFTKINTQPISPAEDPLTGGDYIFQDLVYITIVEGRLSLVPEIEELTGNFAGPKRR